VQPSKKSPREDRKIGIRRYALGTSRISYNKHFCVVLLSVHPLHLIPKHSGPNCLQMVNPVRFNISGCHSYVRNLFPTAYDCTYDCVYMIRLSWVGHKTIKRMLAFSPRNISSANLGQHLQTQKEASGGFSGYINTDSV
jgi:hypothetical protein